MAQPRKLSRGTLEQERDTLRATLRLAVERKSDFVALQT